YLPLTHRQFEPAQGDLLAAVGQMSQTRSKAPRSSSNETPTSIASQMLAKGVEAPRNLPVLESNAMGPLRALLENPEVLKVAQNAKAEMLALRRNGIEMRGLSFDTMVASYVLDPGRRSHNLELLGLEFLGHSMTSYEALCGKGRDELPFDVV